MFSSPEFFEHPSRRLVQAGLLASIAVTLLAAGCASHVDLPNHDAANKPEAPMVATSPLLTCLPVAPAGSAAPLANEAIIHMLAYADRTRRMQATELSQEVIRLGDTASPTEQMQLALVLSQLHQLPDLLHAQELLGRVRAALTGVWRHSWCRYAVGAAVGGWGWREAICQAALDGLEGLQPFIGLVQSALHLTCLLGLLL